MKLVTVATHSDGYFPWLVKSCKRHGAELTVLGWGDIWQGFSWRTHLMLEYLRSLPPDEVVCFIDAYDVILLKSLVEIERRFVQIQQETGCKIVVAQEHIQNSLNKIGANITFGTCKNVNVNAGTYIGYAKDLRAVLHGIYKLNPSFASDDQQSLLTYCRSHPKDVHIDTSNALFYTLVDPLRSLKNSETRIDINKEDWKDSCILHAPATTNITPMLKSLGYDFSKDEEETLSAFHKKAHRQKMWYYFGLFKYSILLLMFAMAIAVVMIRKTLS